MKRLKKLMTKFEDAMAAAAFAEADESETAREIMHEEHPQEIVERKTKRRRPSDFAVNAAGSK